MPHAKFHADLHLLSTVAMHTKTKKQTDKHTHTQTDREIRFYVHIHIYNMLIGYEKY